MIVIMSKEATPREIANGDGFSIYLCDRRPREQWRQERNSQSDEQLFARGDAPGALLCSGLSCGIHRESGPGEAEQPDGSEKHQLSSHGASRMRNPVGLSHFLLVPESSG